VNVLLITIDQWRGDSLSCAGHPCARTPNVDRLAARGVRFARHYAQAAPCGPSRASLLTGTYLHHHRSVGNGTPLDARFTNLALEMTDAGYRPTLFGYTDTTVDPRTVTDPNDPRLRTYEGVLPGFEVEVQLPEAADAWLAWLATKGYDVPASVWDLYADRDTDDPEAADRGPTWSPVKYASEHTEAAFLVERFVDWHRQHDGDHWFSHVTFLRPHPPYVAPAPWHDLVDPAEVPLPVRHDSPEAEAAEHPMVAGAMFVDQVRAPASERDVRQFRATYWGMLAEVDEKLGWLLDHLEASGDADDTLVVLTADHGEQLADHWLTEKLGYFEASYHIPLVVAGPGVVAGRVVDEFTENVDLMPTILSAVGAPVPVQCDGAPLQPFLSGEPRPEGWRDAAHWEWDYRDPRIVELLELPLAASNLAVLRDRHGKYVHFAGMPPAFYDLDADPGELHNVAGDPAYRDRVLDYAQRLLSWRLSTDDETLARLRATPAGIVPLA
jgi:arylsulfatase A-like enzyme